MIQKVEDIKEPLVVGKLYSVPCLVEHKGELEYIIPIINHPHNDIENGQKEVHYHADYRFVICRNYDKNFPQPVNNHSKHVYLPHNDIRPKQYKEGRKLEYIVLPCINSDFNGMTPVSFISKSKLKHDCIHKGKCSHRGFDLSQVKPKNGIITCPLHSLQYDAKTKKLINLNKQHESENRGLEGKI